MYLFKSLCILTKKSALFLCIVQIIIWLSSKSKMQLWGSLTENIYDGVNWCQKIFHHLFLLFKVGLAGSSAIVTATLKCLMHFFNLTETDLPKEVQPQFILDVEKSELHINAGMYIKKWINMFVFEKKDTKVSKGPNKNPRFWKGSCWNR